MLHDVHRASHMLTMEDWFAPTTRLRDLYRVGKRNGDDSSIDSPADREMSSLVELELVTGSSAEDILLHRGFKWSNFYSWAHGKIVWISPDVFFDSTFISTGFQKKYRSFLTVDIGPNEDDTSKESKTLWLCASSEAHATVASGILLQLLTSCESREVSLHQGHLYCEFQIPELAFSHLLVHSHSLRGLRLLHLRLDTCHCRAIDDLARTNLHIEFIRCFPTESGETVLLESIRHNRGPTQLIQCRIDTRRLAEALRGNNIVNSLTLRTHEPYSDEEMLGFVQGLAENEGLVKLSLKSVPITDESWIALWRSVARHPKLEQIVLPDTYEYSSTWRHRTTDAQKPLRSQAIVDALCINTVLHTIELNRDDFDKEIWDSTVYPLLLANMYRPRVRAIGKEEGTWRRKLLGRALGSISSNPALIWMFVSGNANIRLGRVPLKRKRALDSEVPEQ
jgi:hypothetical protein